MALHGEIKVNQVVIADWSAVRKENVEGDTHRYECEYMGRDELSFPLYFEVYHSYADGAAALAAAVLGSPAIKGARYLASRNHG